jgi:hypothetical protein
MTFRDRGCDDSREEGGEDEEVQDFEDVEGLAAGGVVWKVTVRHFGMGR